MDAHGFLTAVCARLGQLHPPPTVEVHGPLSITVTPEGGAPMELRLHNLWWTVHAEPAQFRHRLDQIAGAVSTTPGRDAAHLVPVLRTRDSLPSLAPQLPFAGPLFVATALDGPYTRRLVRRIDADLLQLHDSRLFHVAHNNLKARAAVLQRQRLGQVDRLVLDGDLDSALVLLPEPWRALGATNRLHTCCPARGVVLYTLNGYINALYRTAVQVQNDVPWPLPLVLLQWNRDSFHAAAWP